MPQEFQKRAGPCQEYCNILGIMRVLVRKCIFTCELKENMFMLVCIVYFAVILYMKECYQIKKISSTPNKQDSCQNDKLVFQDIPNFYLEKKFRETRTFARTFSII